MEPYTNWIVNLVTVNLMNTPWGLEEAGLLKSRQVRENFLQAWLLAETWRTPYLKEGRGWLCDGAECAMPNVVCEWHPADAQTPTGWQCQVGEVSRQGRPAIHERHREGHEHSLSGGLGHQCSPIWEFIHRSNRTQVDKVQGQTLGFPQEEMPLFPEVTVYKQKDIKGPVEL